MSLLTIAKAIKTPNTLPAVRIRNSTPFGSLHVVIVVDPKENRDLEVFAQLGKAGDLVASDLEGMCRLISLFLRVGGTLEPVIKQLEGIGSHLSSNHDEIKSLADGLAKTLKKYLSVKTEHGLSAILTGEIEIE